jgi:hypothetical protein
MTEIFIRNNIIYEIEQTDNESREIFLERVKYIIDNYTENNSIDKLIRKSYIWRNHHFFKMKYPPSIMKYI